RNYIKFFCVIKLSRSKSVKDWRKLTMTCLSTGFSPEYVKMSLRKFSTEIPDHLITSSGVRPNDDGTYQLRKSVEILEDDKADYYCYVSHRTLTKPFTWDLPASQVIRSEALSFKVGV
uniref:Immunoglobulin C1-set domain-containing protein n=1 Tax=Astyanax mexicanus TaxID=7994 RepID=A0A3B1JUE9_ASTMX